MEIIRILNITLFFLCFLIALKKGISNFSQGNNQNGWKMLKICLLSLIYIAFSSWFISINKKGGISNESDSYIKDGYSFILSRVKSPSNTSLLVYKYGTEVKNMVETHCQVNLPNCITVGYFYVDTPNSFGALLREDFYVFYRNGIPCHLETEEALKKVETTQNGHLLLNALEMNGCGCN